MKQLSLIIATTALIITSSSHAQQSHQGMNMNGMKMDHVPATIGTATLTTGEVKAVNKDKKTITLKHGPIKSASVEMSAMTMSFPVQDAAILEGIKAGDTVKFTVENIDGAATITVLKK